MYKKSSYYSRPDSIFNSKHSNCNSKFQGLHTPNLQVGFCLAQFRLQQSLFESQWLSHRGLQEPPALGGLLRTLDPIFEATLPIAPAMPLDSVTLNACIRMQSKERMIMALFSFILMLKSNPSLRSFS